MQTTRAPRAAVAVLAGLVVMGSGLSVATAGPGDAVPPQTAITTSVPEVVGPHDVVSVGFLGADDATAPTMLSFECAVDGSPFTSCTSPVTAGPNASGSHQLAVRARDHAGNADLAPATVNWIVDDQPPTVQLDPTSTQQQVVSFRGSDDHTRPEDLSFECAVDQTRLSTPLVEPTNFHWCPPSPFQFGSAL